jgi:hypothetical protein
VAQRGTPQAALLGIYLNDHLASATLAVELARRAAHSRRGKPTGETLEWVAGQLDEDRTSLVQLLKTLDVPVRQYKVLAARAAELIGRLKPNGHLLSRSPLSDVVEAEGLRLAIDANAACWATLEQLADTEPRLNQDRIAELPARARRQREVLAECRRTAVAEALTSPVPGSSRPENPTAGATLPGPSVPPAEASVEQPAKASVEPPAHKELPLPDYDHLPTGSLAARIRALEGADVERLLAYERAHADRLPVLLVLQRRLEELAKGAQPTSGDVNAARPEAPGGPARASASQRSSG